MDRFSPEAKNPPNGPTTLANTDSTKTWKCPTINLKGSTPVANQSVMWLSEQPGQAKGTRSPRLRAGHVKPGIVTRVEVRMYENRQVKSAPPMQPYHVFLGDRAMSWCEPKKYPTRYAKISLQTMSRAGRTNQMRPSMILAMMSQLWNTTMMVASAIQANTRNWYFKQPCLSDSTKPTKPAINPQQQMKAWLAIRAGSARRGKAVDRKCPKQQKLASRQKYQLMNLVMGMLAYFSQSRLMELISLKMRKLAASTSRQHPSCPEAITSTNPSSMRMVHLVRYMKFLLILSPRWVWSTGAAGPAGAVCFFVSSGSENQVEVGSYIYVQIC